jgi:hypothetical protein
MSDTLSDGREKPNPVFPMDSYLVTQERIQGEDCPYQRLE